MSIIGLIIVLIIVGVVLWLVNSMIPMDPKIKTIINVIVIICVLLYVLQAFGILGLNGPVYNMSPNGHVIR